MFYFFFAVSGLTLACRGECAAEKPKENDRARSTIQKKGELFFFQKRKQMHVGNLFARFNSNERSLFSLTG
jgi:hypothetical protein